MNKFISTLGIGFFPYAPGTVASLVTAVVMYYYPMPIYIWVAIFMVGVPASAEAARSYGEKDPSCIIIDEVLGMSLPLLFLPRVLGYYIAAFILFRILDIIKPYPINKSQDFSGGFGIIMDDVLAGLITLVLICGIYAVIA